MEKLKITKIEQTNYTLENEEKTYVVNIIFYGNKIPKENDIIYMPQKILQEKNIYSYGPVNSKYSKNTDANEDDFIKILTQKEEYYLQRYYG